MNPCLPLLMLAVLAMPALAQSPRDIMFPSDASCYLRHYDKAHLSKHQEQIVKEIALGPWDPAVGDGDRLVLLLAVYVRGTDERFVANAYCKNEADHLHCQMEGDAGSFTVTPAKNGAIRLDLTRDGIAFEGEGGFVALSGTSGDDRQFLIPPVPADACP